MVVGIVLVSHSARLAEGLAELAGQVAGSEVAVVPAGGGPDGGLGTSAGLVAQAIARAGRGDGVIVLADLGSALLTVRDVLDQLQEQGPNAGQVVLCDAPFVEGAVAAAVTAAAGCSLPEVVQAAEAARGAAKR